MGYQKVLMQCGNHALQQTLAYECCQEEVMVQCGCHALREAPICVIPEGDGTVWLACT